MNGRWSLLDVKRGGRRKNRRTWTLNKLPREIKSQPSFTPWLSYSLCTLPTTTCRSAAPDYLLIVTRGCENKNRSQREKNKLRTRPCRVWESVLGNVIQPGCISVIVTVTRRQKNLLELRELEPQWVQVCQSSVAHQMAALFTCSGLWEIEELSVVELPSAASRPPLVLSFEFPHPPSAYALNSWTATKLRNGWGGEIMHSLAGVGQEEENYQGKASKKKKMYFAQECQEFQCSSILQWLHDLLENKILAPTPCFSGQNVSFVLIRFAEEEEQIRQHVDPLCCLLKDWRSSCAAVQMLVLLYIQHRLWFCVCACVCWCVCSCSGLKDFIFYSHVHLLSPSTYSKSPTVSLVSDACRVWLQTDGST